MRADRLLSLLLLLQTRGRMTAQELAERLEVSERTVYRDLAALGMAGVPVYAERGPGGGCMLMDGYRTDLTGLTEAEVRTLFMAGAPALLKDLGLGPALEAALLKLLAALPATFRQNVERARQRIHIDALGWSKWEEAVPHLATVQEAVLRDRRLRIVYRPPDGEAGERRVDPLGLVAKTTVWYLVARRDGEMRVYRISRMQDAEVLDEPCARPEGFDLAAYWQEWSEAFAASRPKYPVRARVPAQHLAGLQQMLGDWITEMIAQAPADADGGVTLALTYDSFEEARTRLLGLGTLVEVLEPAELRESVAAYAREIAAFYANALAPA
jgi:predicted DNA-binding transcriptional regulator YafY